MAELHHFAFGWFNPVVAFLMAFLGSLLGLLCTARARRARLRGRRVRWLIMAAVAIGGAGLWLMHFMAMLGFDVPASPVRYDPILTVASLVIAVFAVGTGLFIVCLGKRRLYKLLLGGPVAGCGMAAMHFAGMSALRVNGTIEYVPRLAGATVLIAVVASTVALGFAATIRSWWPIVAAASIMAVGAVGMHYAGMAALRVRLDPDGGGAVSGLSPMLLVVPITLLTAIALLAMAFNALQAMTEEEFDGAGPGGHRLQGGAHAEVPFQLSLPRGEVVRAGGAGAD
ncbi:MAG TPA: MHYT domain-containing protein [Micromonosporaceae bacterium]|jgi:NO-binding membrane sensor protein with MHYT domain|nr:MHYT domain-containing protein [Micromonosporaceae bacterium]